MQKIIRWISCLLTVATHAQTPVFEWVNQISGSLTAQEETRLDGTIIATDTAGNVYNAGTFNGTIDFDPGPGTFSMSSHLNFNVFISKTDSLGNFLWARQIGGVNNEFIKDISVDAAGNVYTTGIFFETVDFDPGPGTYFLTSDLTQSGIFISKLDANGDFLWARQIAPPADGEAGSMTTDASGNLYLSGLFLGTIDLDPGTGTYPLTSGGQADLFICKLDPSGNFVWGKQITGPSTKHVSAIAASASGGLFLTGYFNGLADFNPGTGTFELSSADNDVFITRLDAAGNFVWAKKAGGLSDDKSYLLTLDADENVYIAGSFSISADLDPGIAIYELTSTGPDDTFFAKLDAAGDFIWASNIDLTLQSIFQTALAMAATPAGNLHIAGGFIGNIDFDPGPGNTTLSAATLNGFILSIDTDGNFMGVSQLENEEIEAGVDIATDSSDNVYITGYFSGTADFDLGPGISALTAQGSYDLFILKFSKGKESSSGIPENGMPTTLLTYPNPFTNLLQVIIPQENTGRVEILNSAGILVYAAAATGTVQTIDLQSLAGGLYFIKAIGSNGVTALGRIVKE